MNVEITPERERELIERITRLAREKREIDAELARRELAIQESAEREHDAEQAAARQQFDADHAQLVADYEAAREAVYCDYETAGCGLAQEEDNTLRRAAEAHAESLDAAKTLCRHTSHKIQAAYKENSQRPKAQYAQFKQQAAARAAEIESFASTARQAASRYCEWPEASGPPPVVSRGLSGKEHFECAAAAMSRAAQASFAIGQEPAARFLNDGWPLLIFIVALLALVYPCWLLVSITGWPVAIGIGLCGALALGIGVRQIARALACRQTLKLVPAVVQAVGEAQGELAQAIAAARREGERAYRQLGEERDRDLGATKREWKVGRRREKAEHAAQTERAIADYAAKRRAIEDAHEARFELVEGTFAPRIAELRRKYEAQAAAIKQQLATRVESEREHCARERGRR